MRRASPRPPRSLRGRHRRPRLCRAAAVYRAEGQRPRCWRRKSPRGCVCIACCGGRPPPLLVRRRGRRLGVGRSATAAATAADAAAAHRSVAAAAVPSGFPRRRPRPALGAAQEVRDVRRRRGSAQRRRRTRVRARASAARCARHGLGRRGRRAATAPRGGARMPTARRRGCSLRAGCCGRVGGHRHVASAAVTMAADQHRAVRARMRAAAGQCTVARRGAAAFATRGRPAAAPSRCHPISRKSSSRRVVLARK
mmetsp:Transcript_1284/g.2967  ORF Transcript_1284/g.2967 Transcript_1284/m.2967 type:complete len:254 (+) Transcript_1284:134-895(+)